MKSITVVAAVIEWQGQVLCMQRGDTPHDYTAFHWEFPGGKIEPGETPRQALHRELLEEMKMEVEVGEYISTIDYDYPDFHITLMFYRCTPVGPLGDDGYPSFTRLEHHDHRWLNPSQLHTLSWCPADYAILPLI